MSHISRRVASVNRLGYIVLVVPKMLLNSDNDLLGNRAALASGQCLDGLPDMQRECQYEPMLNHMAIIPYNCIQHKSDAQTRDRDDDGTRGERRERKRRRQHGAALLFTLMSIA